MQKYLSSFLFAILAAAVLSVTAFGGPTDDATQRIKDRLVQIDKLKASGDVGEAMTGYLAKRTVLGGRQNMVVDGENADRHIVYRAIAGKTDQTVEEVGEQRAIQIAIRARQGVWLQKPDGEWYQKP